MAQLIHRPFSLARKIPSIHFNKKTPTFATWWRADMRKLGRFFSKRQEFQDFQANLTPKRWILQVPFHKKNMGIAIYFHVKFGSMLDFRGGVFSVHVLKL